VRSGLVDHARASFDLRYAAAAALARGGSRLLRAGLGLLDEGEEGGATSEAETLSTASPASTLASHLQRLLWPAALALLQDADDEVREAARGAVALALTRGGRGEEADEDEALQLAAAAARILARLPTGLRPLAPPAEAFDGRCAHTCLVLPLVGEAHMLVLAHAALLRAAERGGEEGVRGASVETFRRRQIIAAAALDTLAASAGAVLEGAAKAVEQAVVDATLGNAANVGDGAAGADAPLPFRTSMLQRSMFLPDADNEFAEPALGGALAAAAFAAGCAAAGVGAMVAGAGAGAAQRYAQLRFTAAAVLAAASETDATPMIDGVLGNEGPWLALDGVDDAPTVFAGARVAEALLAEGEL
jgi:hypothetical protein